MADDYARTRLELQDLASAYARGVDRRDYASIGALFTPDARLAIADGEGKVHTEMLGARKIERGMRGIEQYDKTTHFVGQQRVEVDGDVARGETYCIAYHLHDVDGQTLNYVMSIRYQDSFARAGGAWKFSERVLHVDWTDERPVAAPAQ